MSVQSSSVALLPAHLGIISQCWDESLSKAPIAERVRLISFLIQLRPHFPTWKGTLKNIFHSKYLILFSVLSWDVIVETLVEYDDDTRDSRIRISGGVRCLLFANVNYTDFEISMTWLMPHQIPKRPSSEYVLI